MCEPTTLAIASIAIGAYGEYSSGRQQEAQLNQQAELNRINAENNRKVAEYNAQINEQNAKYYDDQARDTRNRGAQDAAVIRENIIKTNARARAVQASGGLLTDTGTFLDLMGDNAAAGELNALTTYANYERDAYGQDFEAYNQRERAKINRWQGETGVQVAAYESSILEQNASAAKRAGTISAGTTLVSGASNYYSRYPDISSGSTYNPGKSAPRRKPTSLSGRGY